MSDELQGSAREIEDLIRARYGLIYVVSPEEVRVENAIRKIGTKRKRKVLAWSCTEGFTDLLGKESYSDIQNELKALNFIANYQGDAVFVMRDYHPYLKNPAVTRRLRDLNRDFKEGNDRRTIVLLSGVLNIPAEIEKDIAVVDFELPNSEEIEQIVDSLLTSLPNLATEVRTDPDAKRRVVEAALGLTKTEAENTFAKSLIQTKDFDIDTIVNEKKGIIRKSGMLEFYETNMDMSGVGGMEIMKDWFQKRAKAFLPDARAFGLPMPKGILLLGIPGCGKSLTAKALGHQWHVPLLRFDIGKVMGSLVGQSEENMRKAINLAEAIAPCILWLDELEKGFGGVSGGSTDSGTSQRVFATFLTWMQDKTSPVFVLATANNVAALPPELLRKGRFDEIFFVDLPTPEERGKIVRIHVKKKNRDPEMFDVQQVVDATQGFSGSEIEQALISCLYDLFEEGVDFKHAAPESAEFGEAVTYNTERMVASCKEIIPLSYTMKEMIDGMRDWSRSRARRASAITTEEFEAEQVRQLEI
jgi:SpoVK/Ycf46/Vps4 family AAA+-type ATPase